MKRLAADLMLPIRAMEERTGWGAGQQVEIPRVRRRQVVNSNENLDRWFSCDESQAQRGLRADARSDEEREVGRPPMVTWTREELMKIATAEELQLASLRRDETLGSPVTIWVVRVGDDLYVRSWKGGAGAWFRATQVRHAGHIEADGVGKDVTFVVETEDDLNDWIDAAYRTKYRRRGGRYVDPMVAPTARATTIKLVPRSPVTRR